MTQKSGFIFTSTNLFKKNLSDINITLYIVKQPV